MEVEGFFDEPVAEVKIKPWHIVALLGVGGLAAYLIFKKKDAPPAPAPLPALPAPKPEVKPAGTSGLEGFADLGEQIEPLYEGNALVDEARQYSEQGWTVFKIPTGEENVMKNRERFPIHRILAAPPGRRIPKKGIRIDI